MGPARPRDETGVYVNFLDRDDQDRVRIAYGEDKYRRLVGLNNRYDPGNVFPLNPNVAPSILVLFVGLGAGVAVSPLMGITSSYSTVDARPVSDWPLPAKTGSTVASPTSLGLGSWHFPFPGAKRDCNLMPGTLLHAARGSSFHIVESSSTVEKPRTD